MLVNTILKEDVRTFIGKQDRERKHRKDMNRLSDEKAVAIASEYATNGFQKVKALLAIGYSKHYANHVGLKLFDNEKVKLALTRINALQAAKTGFTIDQAHKMYLEDRAFARKCKQSGSATAATTGICRLYGMDKDAGTGEKTVIIISPGPKVVESEVIDAESV